MKKKKFLKRLLIKFMSLKNIMLEKINYNNVF